MDDLIRSLINFALSPIRTIVTEVANRLQAVYGAFANTLSRARGGLLYWVVRGQAWLSSAANHAWQTAHSIRWLMLVIIPAIAAEAAEAARRYAADLVNVARTIAAVGLAQLQAWAAARLTDALRAISALQTWATGQLAALVVDLRRIKDHVFGPLASPDRLAAWLVGAMFNALLAFAWARAATLAEIAWRHRKTVPSRTVDLIDDIADRIF